LLTPQAFRKAIEDSVPAAARELNLRAFKTGFEYGSIPDVLVESLETLVQVTED
jgi:hypothetical protein